MVYDERYAWPGDDDLDLDIDGVTLTRAVRLGCLFQLNANGGFGWMMHDGKRMTFPVLTDRRLGHFPIRMSLQGAPESLLIEFEQRLTRWVEQAMPLRIVGAPGRFFTILEDNETVVMADRR